MVPEPRPTSPRSTSTRATSTRATHRWWPTLLTLLLVVFSLGWLGWPLWSSTTAPNAAQQSAEARPALLALVAMSCALLAVVRRFAGIRTVQAIAAITVLNTAVRPLLGAGSAGFEPVYLLPFVAGAFAGPAAGWLVGFWSCLASAAWMGLFASSTGSQAVVWALMGAVGGVLHLLPRLARAVLAPVLGLLAAAMIGVAYNLPSWSVTAPLDANSYVVGADLASNASRLLAHTWQTSWAVDLVRTLGTGVALLFTGPILTLLGRVFGAPPTKQQTTTLRPLRSRKSRTDHARWQQSLWHKENPSD